jgi:hypothetical protein
MADLDFEIFGCGSHFFQAKDAFNRHLNPAAPKWAMNGAVSDEPIHFRASWRWLARPSSIRRRI